MNKLALIERLKKVKFIKNLLEFNDKNFKKIGFWTNNIACNWTNQLPYLNLSLKFITLSLKFIISSKIDLWKFIMYEKEKQMKIYEICKFMKFMKFINLWNLLNLQNLFPKIAIAINMSITSILAFFFQKNW